MTFGPPELRLEADKRKVVKPGIGYHRFCSYARIWRVTTAEELRSFDVGGYVLRPELSDETRWEFERPQPPPKT